MLSGRFLAQTIRAVKNAWPAGYNPRCGEVYNIGGSRHSNCSIIDAIQRAEDLCTQRLWYCMTPRARAGDHMWWISDVSKFRRHFPRWTFKYSLEDIFQELAEAARIRHGKAIS